MPTGSRAVGALTERVASLLRQRIADLNRGDGRVADDAGIPRASFSRLLNAKKPIYLEQLDSICEVLGLEIGWVLDEADRQASGRVRLISTALAETSETADVVVNGSLGEGLPTAPSGSLTDSKPNPRRRRGSRAGE